MSPADLYAELSPTGRVGTAITPFLAALAARLLFGKNRFTRGLLSISTTWFAVNVLMSPFSDEFRGELLGLGRLFR